MTSEAAQGGEKGGKGDRKRPRRRDEKELNGEEPGEGAAP